MNKKTILKLVLWNRWILVEMSVGIPTYYLYTFTNVSKFVSIRTDRIISFIKENVDRK